MEIDKVFSNDVDGVADNLFSAVKNSVSEIKAMQQRKAAENVQLVIQALKKIESDLQDKYDGVTTVIEKRVSTIKDGRDGLDGRNGRDGKDGRPGRDGAPGARGAMGVPGTDGRDGEDGVSVTDAKIDFDGSLVISLSSGREINVGEVVAPDLAEKIKVITNGGGTSQSVLDSLASLQAQITALSNLGAVNYVGTWDASTNNPTITSGSGDKGDYYVVSVAGSTSIDGQTLWGVGDWIIFNGVVWQRVDGGSTGDFTTVNASGNITTGGDIFTNPNFGIFFSGPSSFSTGIFSSSDGSQMRFYAGGTVDALRLTGTGFGVFNNSPAAALDVTGTARVSGTVTLSGGTANGVAYLNGSKVLTTGSALTFDGTNLGLNCTATNFGANYRTIEAKSASTTTSGVFRASSSDASQKIDLFIDAGVGTLRTDSNHPLAFSLNNSEQMRLTSTGLGIGNSSPTAKLDVTGTAAISGAVTLSGGTANGVAYLNASKALTTGSALTFDGALLTNTVSDAATALKLSGATGKVRVRPYVDSTYGVVFDSTNAAESAYLPLSLFGSNIYSSADTAAIWRIGGSEQMRLTSTGLGIGTSSPTAKLEVNGSFVTTADASGLTTFGRFSAGYAWSLIRPSSTATGIEFRTNAGDALYQLDQSSGANKHIWYTGANERARITSAGNLGVGTTDEYGRVNIQRFTSAPQSTLSIGDFATATNDVGIYLRTTTGTAGISTAGGPIAFYRGGPGTTESARITSEGYFKASNGGTYVGISASYHELRKTENNSDWTVYISNTAATATNQYGTRIDLSGDPNSVGNEFLYMSAGATQRATFRSNGGLANYQANDVNLSDLREKTNFAPAKSYLDTICAIPVQTFNYIDQSEDDPGLTLGVVAQDVQAVAPELVMESNWGSKDEPKMRLSIYQTDLQYALMKALQELKAEFDAYKATHP